jgi:hypothetical protein
MATRIMFTTNNGCKLYEPWASKSIIGTYQQRSTNVLMVTVQGENIRREYHIREYLSTTECRATRIT